MDRKRLLSLFFILLCCLCSTALCEQTVTFPASERFFANPFLGLMVWSEDISTQQQPFDLVYVDATWAELEPEEGVYDLDAFEVKHNLPLWRRLGKHIVLRVLLDEPLDEAHIDLPQWLCDAIGGAGTAYSTSYGSGFSPDYTNEYLIERHALLLRALGERYDGDDLLYCVELGTLGHWGEWHTHPDLTGAMPGSSIRAKYLQAYQDAFPTTYLLLRRPFAEGAEQGFGLFNDAAGHVQATQEWLDWIEYGGCYGVTGEEDGLVAMQDAWQTAPIGGELNSGINAEALLTEDLSEAQALFTASHASWIGPNSLTFVQKNGRLQKGLDALLATLGYRIRISSVTAEYTPAHRLLLTVTVTNDGCAPFYEDWPLTLFVAGGDHSFTIPLPMRLSRLMPGDEKTITLNLCVSRWNCTEIDISAGIVEPKTDRCAVRLAMDATTVRQETELMRFKVPAP